MSPAARRTGSVVEVVRGSLGDATSVAWHASTLVIALTRRRFLSPVCRTAKPCRAWFISGQCKREGRGDSSAINMSARPTPRHPGDPEEVIRVEPPFVFPWLGSGRQDGRDPAVTCQWHC